MRGPKTIPPPTLMVAAILLVSVVNVGCVRRRMTVRTNPPGALVHVDNQLIGSTPVSSSFTYYASRDIRVEKEGFATQTVRHRISPPWYQFPPLDFITETLWPGEIRDERIVDITLTPQAVEPTEAILARADEMRQQARTGVIPNITGIPSAITFPNVAPPPVSVPATPLSQPVFQPSPAPGSLPREGVPFDYRP